MKAKPMADIIYADDDKNNRYVISAHLRLRGHKVREAAGGEEALRLLAESVPDLVILDIMMPDLNGYETCRQMRSAAGMATVPILALTALEGAAESPRAKDAGFTAVIGKPLSMFDLHGHIDGALAAAAA